MRKIPREGSLLRTYARRGLTVAAVSGLLFAGFAPPADAARAKTWVVKPGQSIQKRVNKARSGDIIQLRAGTYAQAVCVVKKSLTITGAGRERTILVPPKKPKKNKCWTPGAPEGGKKEDVSAIKFLNPKGPVTVTNLQTRNHPESGIVAWRAKGFVVRNTKGVGHRHYGILASANSTNVRIENNVEYGVVRNNVSGTAGISIGDSKNARAVIRNNYAENLNLGIFIRESRGVRIAKNGAYNNCVGFLVFDDASTERPTTKRNVIGGNVDLLENSSVANNKFCMAGRNGDLKVSGVGMAVVNADDVTIARNYIANNRPSVTGTNFPPAGLSILTVPSPTGGPNPGPATNIRVARNTIQGNVPLDVLKGSQGPKITFSRNTCGKSTPAAIC